jgi:hypothetical protein
VFIEAVYSGPSGDANFDFQASTGQTKYLDSEGHGIDRTTTLNPPASLLGPNQQVNQAGQSAWFYVPPDVEFNLAVNVFSVSQSPMDVSGDVSTWRLIHSAPSTFTINGNGVEQNFVTDTDFIGAIYVNDSHISVITSDGGDAPTFDWYLANADYATLTTVTDPRDFVNDQKYPATPEVFELSGSVTSSLGTSMWDHAVRVAVHGDAQAYSVLLNGTQTIDPANTGGTPDFEADVVTFELKLSTG